MANAFSGLRLLDDIEIYDNPALYSSVLNSPALEALLETVATKGALSYRGKVARRSGRLAESAHPEVSVGGHKNDRLIGKIVVAGDAVVAPEPWKGAPFYYGALHEFGDGGNPPSGRDFPAADDLVWVRDVMKQ